MKFRLIVPLLILIAPCGINAQDYGEVKVTVSQDKIRGEDGKIYYFHPVQEKETLYSLARAYGVSIDDICDANPLMDLRGNGLKKGTSILIPCLEQKSEAMPAEKKPAYKDRSSRKQAKEETAVEEEAAGEDSDKQDSSDNKKAVKSGVTAQDYKVHTVKWYEDIYDISEKYKVPVAVIMDYNELSSEKLAIRQKLRIPLGDYTATGEAKVGDGAGSNTIDATSEEELSGEPRTTEDESFEWKTSLGRRSVNLTLALPVNASGKPDGNYLDLYSGVLLAARDMGQQGTVINLNVYDVGGGNMPLTEDIVGESDIVIGPVSVGDLTKVAGMNSRSTPIVSPLDPKAATLAREQPFLVQVPAPSWAQYEDLVRWVKEDISKGDKVILLAEKNPNDVSARTCITACLDSLNVDYTPYFYSILEGRNAAAHIEGMATKDGTNRVVVASDNEAFMYDVVGNLSTLPAKKLGVVMYAPSRIRSFDTIEVEALHALNLHVSTSYFIDYSGRDVQDFLLKYRALYNAEPSQYAFQGYDIASYFIKTCSQYGKNWFRHLDSRGVVRMLQSDFVFRKSGSGGGYVNYGIRRIVYEPDYNVRLVK